MAILEAMAAGVPVVATQVGGNAEIIPDREHGILVPSGDVAALTNALSETLSNRDAAIKMVKHGQQRVYEFFSEQHMIQRIETLYIECMARLNRRQSAASKLKNFQES